MAMLGETISSVTLDASIRSDALTLQQGRDAPYETMAAMKYVFDFTTQQWSRVGIILRVLHPNRGISQDDLHVFFAVEVMDQGPRPVPMFAKFFRRSIDHVCESDYFGYGESQYLTEDLVQRFHLGTRAKNGVELSLPLLTCRSVVRLPASIIPAQYHRNQRKGFFSYRTADTSEVVFLMEPNIAACAGLDIPFAGADSIYYPSAVHLSKEELSEMAEGFSHYCYHISGGRLVVCGMQRDSGYLLDPVIHTLDGYGFGLLNGGDTRLRRWASKHRCNSVCRYAGLPPLNPDEPPSHPLSKETRELEHLVKQLMAYRSVCSAKALRVTAPGSSAASTQSEHNLFASPTQNGSTALLSESSPMCSARNVAEVNKEASETTVAMTDEGTSASLECTPVITSHQKEHESAQVLQQQQQTHQAQPLQRVPSQLQTARSTLEMTMTTSSSAATTARTTNLNMNGTTTTQATEILFSTPKEEIELVTARSTTNASSSASSMEFNTNTTTSPADVALTRAPPGRDATKSASPTTTTVNQSASPTRPTRSMSPTTVAAPTAKKSRSPQQKDASEAASTATTTTTTAAAARDVRAELRKKYRSADPARSEKEGTSSVAVGGRGEGAAAANAPTTPSASQGSPRGVLKRPPAPRAPPKRSVSPGARKNAKDGVTSGFSFAAPTTRSPSSATNSSPPPSFSGSPSFAKNDTVGPSEAAPVRPGSTSPNTFLCTVAPPSESVGSAARSSPSPRPTELLEPAAVATTTTSVASTATTPTVQPKTKVVTKTRTKVAAAAPPPPAAAPAAAPAPAQTSAGSAARGPSPSPSPAVAIVHRRPLTNKPVTSPSTATPCNGGASPGAAPFGPPRSAISPDTVNAGSARTDESTARSPTVSPSQSPQLTPSGPMPVPLPRTPTARPPGPSDKAVAMAAAANAALAAAAANEPAPPSSPATTSPTTTPLPSPGAKEAPVVVPATKLVFDLSTWTWTPTSTVIRVCNPSRGLAEGGMRVCFEVVEVNPDTGDEQVHVAKMFRRTISDVVEKDYYNEAEVLYLCRVFAEHFNKLPGVPKPLHYVDCNVVYIQRRDIPEAYLTKRTGFFSYRTSDTGAMMFSLEPMLTGNFTKYNSNNGQSFITNEVPLPYEANEARRKVLQIAEAFTHYTLLASEGTLLVCDIQGVGTDLTDPQVHSYNRVGLGIGNMGSEGMLSFARRHRCNAVCQKLGLPRIDKRQPTTLTLEAVQSNPFMVLARHMTGEAVPTALPG